MIQFIVFSRKRPLQLYGYLESIFQRISDQVAVAVLIRIDEPYASAYAEVEDRFPYVHFRHETNFRQDVFDLLDRSSAEYVSFGCDDVVFTGTIHPHSVAELINSTHIIGLSLRLGRSVTHGMFGELMPQPALISHDTHRFLTWNIEHSKSVGDWAYPWEVLGTIYPRLFVEAMLAQIYPTNPSQLEELGTHIWATTLPYRQMACYPTPRIVVPTVNVVQTEYPGNGVVGMGTLPPEFLLDCWQRGLRLDTYAFASRAYPSWRIPNFYLQRKV